MLVENMVYLRHIGALLEVLSEMAACHSPHDSLSTGLRHIEPHTFIEWWQEVFAEHLDALTPSVSPGVIAVFSAFDDQINLLFEDRLLSLSQNSGALDTTHDELWIAAGELATWALNQLAQLSTPEHFSFSLQ